MNALTIHAVPVLKDNYVWILVEPKTQSALIVDPGEAKPVIHFLEQQGLTPVAILITHHHWDHTNGIMELKERYQLPVYGPANEKISGLTHPIHESTIHINPFPPIEVLTIPGHTLGHLAYYTNKALFCGDTLFASGCGRIFEGTPSQMYTSLQKIAELPPDTRIYCAHEYTLNNLRFAELVEPNNPRIAERMQTASELRKKNLPTLPSSLQDEKQTNPFLRCDEREIIASAEKFSHHSLPTPLDVFTHIRKWKDGF